MNALGDKIARLIAANGPITIAEYMAMALQDPEHGYYTTRDPFGASGDFITAPEVSQMFGELLGLWFVQAWRDQGSPAPCRLVELGPGRGTLMADALRAARLDPDFLASVEVVLVESSPFLREIQSETLKQYAQSPSPPRSGGEGRGEGAHPSVRWLDKFDDSLSDRSLFLIANEFFDALPIRQFVMTERGWCERLVGIDKEGALAFGLSPRPVSDSSMPPDRRGAPLGGVCEICLAGQALVSQVADVIGTHGGAAVVIDYGYDQPGFGETLQSVSNHSFAEILNRPGESDLSAHVDFPQLAAAAWPTAAAIGPVTQRKFLGQLGIAERLEVLKATNPNADDSLRTEFERLTDESQMGTLFKAMAIVPFGARQPAGFNP